MEQCWFALNMFSFLGKSTAIILQNFTYKKGMYEYLWFSILGAFF